MRKTPNIPTSIRMVKIIEVVGKAGNPLTLAEINRELDLPKQSLHRLCDRLLEEGYLVKVENRRLASGEKLRNLARHVYFDTDQKIVRHQILQKVAQKIGETINLVVPEAKGMTYIDRVETDWPLRIQLPIGSNVPFHCTASGKTYLSKLPPRERRILTNNLDLSQLTENTICTSSALIEELERVSDQGFALDMEEFIPGMVAAAVPISDKDGNYIASLAFHGPTQRLSLDDLLQKMDFLFDSAKQLQEVMA
ncbi:MAG: IclR family transcriptional regulator [Paracoccaceae bacterium]|nr:IclR family transcriptional regulator [Paracoccaceae bacterium]